MKEANNSKREKNEILDNEVLSQCLRDEAGWVSCCCSPQTEEISDDSVFIYENFGPSSILNFKDKNDLISLCELKDDLNWRLLYRGSRDGFLSKSFHKKCDKHPNTLTVIKTDLGKNFFVL